MTMMTDKSVNVYHGKDIYVYFVIYKADDCLKVREIRINLGSCVNSLTLGSSATN